MTRSFATVPVPDDSPATRGEPLTEEQLGHLRHLGNLSLRQENDWSSMQQRALGQDDGATYRYQLAYGAYALALAHVHRLPAAPGAFKPVFERLIQKMLLPEVWTYWRNVSRGGGIFNPDIARDEEWDPVVRDNIMYSAYVQSMTLLHHHLFDDDRFTRPGALTFATHAPFWAGGDHSFAYDQNSLTEHLYWQLVENGYVGIACQPDCVFQVCIQPAILGFRLHDLITGGTRADEVTQSYEQAWRDFGRLDDNGHYVVYLRQNSGRLVAPERPLVFMDGWLGTLLNMWHREFVRTHYPAQIGDALARDDAGRLFVAQPEKSGARMDLGVADHGWVATWAGELGDTGTLEGLLAYADHHLSPTWSDGGLHYPRNDRRTDEAGHPTRVDPLTGNVLLAYARLNVPDGLWRLYHRPWGPEHHREPALTEVDHDVDVTRAVFADRKLTFTVRARPGHRSSVTVGRIGGRGGWRLLRDGTPAARSDSSDTVAGLTVREGELVLDCPHETTTYELVFDTALQDTSSRNTTRQEGPA